MSPERWQQVEEIFQTALDLAPGERAPYVERMCANDAELKREVEALLAQYEEAEESDDFLDAPLVEQSGLQALASLMDEAADPMLGSRIGAYQIKREIGRGGMGAVYLATRADGAFRRRVAIKVIKRGMDTDFILRRFRHERRILAALEHYNIARFLDGGATPAGQPYFVMEYIEGQPLYAYCDARRLTVRERLQLFCQVCDAVHHAHQNKIIHRDLKPSNILATSAGAPKLIDFGIAKLLNAELASDTAPQTWTAMRLMTVEYASPEQAQGLPVTILSDVYSLGVLLYELLTGCRPYRFPNRSPHEVARVISEEEPERPSLAVSCSDNSLSIAHVDQEAVTVGHLGELRNETLESLRRALEGSLDRIALKALRKKPAERYQSAAELREDIMRYLEGRPVSAPLHFPAAATSPPLQTARAQNAATKLVAVLPLKLLDTGAGGATDDNYLSVGLADALITRLSNVRSLTVRPTGAVLRYGDEGTDPLAAGRELGVDSVLDGRIKRAHDRIRVSLQLLDVRSGTSVWAHQFDERFADVLELEDSISEKVAKSLVPHLTGAERRRLEKRSTNRPEAYEAFLRGRFYWNLMTEEGFAKAIGFYERAVALDPEYALAYSAIAEYYIHLGIQCALPFAECSRRAKEAAEKAATIDPTLADAQAALGLVAINLDFDWQTAEKYTRRAVEINPNSFTAHQWLKTLYLQTGRFDEALTEANRLLELDPDSIFGLHLLAWTHHNSRRFDESIVVHRQLIKNEPLYAFGRLSFSWVLRCAGRFEESVAQANKGVERAPENPMYLTALAAAYAANGQRDEALETLGKIDRMSATRYVSPYMLATAYCALGDKDRAFEQLENALAIRDVWIVWIGVEPQFDRLRADSRFRDLLRRMNHPLAS